MPNGSQSLKQICDDILEKFDVDRELAEKDLYRFVGQMQQNQMIDFLPGNSSDPTGENPLKSS
jgi:hypothetical protein